MAVAFPLGTGVPKPLHTHSTGGDSGSSTIEGNPHGLSLWYELNTDALRAVSSEYRNVTHPRGPSSAAYSPIKK